MQLQSSNKVKHSLYVILTFKKKNPGISLIRGVFEKMLVLADLNLNRMPQITFDQSPIANNNLLFIKKIQLVKAKQLNISKHI